MADKMYTTHKAPGAYSNLHIVHKMPSKGPFKGLFDVKKLSKLRK